jgi:hypothetical protein
VIPATQNEGVVVGYYIDANGAYHGFIYQSENDYAVSHKEHRSSTRYAFSYRCEDA